MLCDRYVCDGCICYVTGMCARSGCLRRRAVNQLTGQLHDHCSIDCMRQDQAAEPVSNMAEENGTAVVVL